MKERDQTHTTKGFVVCLNCDRIKTFDEFVFIAFHEFAHVQLDHSWSGKDNKERELEAWKVSMEWFKEYNENKTDPVKKAEIDRIFTTPIGDLDPNDKLKI